MALGYCLKTLWRKTLPIFAAFPLVILLQACDTGNDVGTEQSVLNAEVRLLAEIREAAKNVKPIDTHEALADMLDIPLERAQSIVVGSQGPQLFSQRLASNRLDWICSGGACVCTGDPDCNDMFETVCSSSESNGVCFEFPGGGVVCMCTPRFAQ